MVMIKHHSNIICLFSTFVETLSRRQTLTLVESVVLLVDVQSASEPASAHHDETLLRRDTGA